LSCLLTPFLALHRLLAVLDSIQIDTGIKALLALSSFIPDLT
jgi:hypothetical protein